MSDDIDLPKEAYDAWDREAREHVGAMPPFESVPRGIQRAWTMAVVRVLELDPSPVPMLLWCPECAERHVDKGAFAEKLHHTHACQHCGHVWRPAVKNTVGVQFLPGFKD